MIKCNKDEIKYLIRRIEKNLKLGKTHFNINFNASKYNFR